MKITTGVLHFWALYANCLHAFSTLDWQNGLKIMLFILKHKLGLGLIWVL